jgi:hypothetical protein
MERITSRLPETAGLKKHFLDIIFFGYIKFAAVFLEYFKSRKNDLGGQGQGLGLFFHGKLSGVKSLNSGR